MKAKPIQPFTSTPGEKTCLNKWSQFFWQGKQTLMPQTYFKLKKKRLHISVQKDTCNEGIWIYIFCSGVGNLETTAYSISIHQQNTFDTTNAQVHSLSIFSKIKTARLAPMKFMCWNQKNSTFLVHLGTQYIRYCSSSSHRWLQLLCCACKNNAFGRAWFWILVNPYSIFSQKKKSRYAGWTKKDQKDT